MPVRARPLSPHLGIYRWQIGNTLSILHRLTGIALALGIVALSYWLISLAGGDACLRFGHPSAVEPARNPVPGSAGPFPFFIIC